MHCGVHVNDNFACVVVGLYWITQQALQCWLDTYLGSEKSLLQMLVCVHSGTQCYVAY
jgi:hypothetical protein